MDRWLTSGWVDTFRHVHGDAEGHYTWWSNRPGIRERNVGWRIDYGLVREEDIHRGVRMPSFSQRLWGRITALWA